MAGDNNLEAVLNVLKQNAEELEAAWRNAGLELQISEFETNFLEEQTAKELGICGGAVLALSVLHTSIKSLLPVKVATSLIGGAWVVGGAIIFLRLTAGTAAGWARSTRRNERRKKELLKRVATIERRIQLLTANLPEILPLIEPTDSTSAAPQELQHQSQAASGGVPSPAKKPSPTGSTGSSIELVEAPEDDEFEREVSRSPQVATETPSPPSEAAAAKDLSLSSSGSGATGSGSGGGGAFESWRRYATLGHNKKE